jgi:hypothetical protein
MASLEDAIEKGPIQVPAAEPLDANSGLAVDPLSSIPARTIYCVQLPRFRSHGGSGAKVGYKLCAITSKNANGDLARKTMQVPDKLWPPEAFVIMIEHAVPDLAKELLVGDILTFYHGNSDIPSPEYCSTPHAVLPCGAEVMSVFPLHQYWMYEVHFPASYHSLVTCIMESLLLGFRTFSQTSEEAQTSLCSSSSLNLRRSQLTSGFFPASDFGFPAYSTTASHLDNVIHKTGYYPMSNFASPASFMTASSPASFMTARSTYASPAWSTSMGLSPASFMTARSNHASPAYTSTIPTIREDQPIYSPMSAPSNKLHDTYYWVLHQENIVQSFDKELNWSGKGQHVTFLSTDFIPFRLISHLGASLTAKVDKVLCRRIALARKTTRCSHKWSIADAMREVHHLQNLRHCHIVQLVGSYLRGRDFSILMYPAADCHLGTFLENTTDMDETSKEYLKRLMFLSSSLACLASAITHVHEHTTKHMDIKPQNILVCKIVTNGFWWRVYLADFGLSRSFTSQGHSQTDGPTSRTPRYCAPEVFQYELRGRSADVFSLGCVFLDIMTVIRGRDPQDFADFRRGEGTDDSFHANLPMVLQWLKTVCFKAPPSGSSSEREVAPDRDALLFSSFQRDMVCRMVDPNPAARPTAEELLRYPIFPPWPCCDSPPEKYVAYEPQD